MKYPPLSMRMNHIGKENIKNNKTIQPRTSSIDSLKQKNSVMTNPEELKKFVNVDFDNWQEIMQKATASMNAPKIVQVGETP